MDCNVDLFQSFAGFSVEMSWNPAEALESLHRPHRLHLRFSSFFKKYRLERFNTSSAQPSGFLFFFPWGSSKKACLSHLWTLPPRLHAPGCLVQLLFPLFGISILTTTPFLLLFFGQMISQRGVNWYWFYFGIGISHFLFLLHDLIITLCLMYIKISTIPGHQGSPILILLYWKFAFLPTFQLYHLSSTKMFLPNRCVSIWLVIAKAGNAKKEICRILVSSS